MHKLIILLIFISIISSSCKKDLPIQENENIIKSNCSYNTFTIDTFEKTYKHLVSHSSTISPIFYFPVKYLYFDPVFNPNNPYEIAYLRMNPTTTNNNNNCGKELWKFNFCTGKAEKLTENVCSSPDWSSKGWIIFTAFDKQLWKIKDNGDSLIQLTNTPGYNKYAKWSPNGHLYAYRLDQSGILSDSYGKTKNIPIKPLSWLNDDLVIGINNSDIVKFNIYTETTEIINSIPIDAINSPFDPKNNILFKHHFGGFRTDVNDYWIKHNLNTGINDTLKILYDSYFYSSGVYNHSTNKIATVLVESSWKDSIKNERNGKSRIIIMNPDGTDERLVQLPE